MRCPPSRRSNGRGSRPTCRCRGLWWPRNGSPKRRVPMTAGRRRRSTEHEQRLLAQKVVEPSAARQPARPAIGREAAARSMRTPMSRHSARKSSMLQRWMLGVSYQLTGSDGGAGMRPPNTSAQRTCQCAEVGERHDRRACRPAACCSQHLRAARASPAGSGTGSRSRRRRRDSRAGRCRRRPGSPTGPWPRRRSRRPG